MSSPYDRIAAQWVSRRSSFRPGEKDYFDILLDSLEPDSLVLDLGCGSCVPHAVCLHEAGHRVHGIDASVELLKSARREKQRPARDR